MANLIPPYNPNLPQAQEAYSRPTQEQLNNVLRLYFTQINNAFRAVLGENGGRYIDCPNGLFFSTVNHTLAAINTGYALSFENTYLSNGVSRTNTTRITCAISGVYNFQFSGQLKSTNSSAKTVYVWLRRDGVDIGYSTHAYTISGSDTHLEVGWNFDIDMTAGQYMEIVWAGTDVNVSMTAVAATTPHPGIPSAVIAVNFVAPLPATLPTPP